MKPNPIVTSVIKTGADSGSEVGRVERGINATAQGVNETVVRFPGWLTAGFWFCVLIAVVVVIRRMIAPLTAGTSGALPELSNLDAWFRAHAVLTWVHISVALAFVLLLPFVFRVSAAKPGAMGKPFFALGAITGATAYGMSRRRPAVPEDLKVWDVSGHSFRSGHVS